MADNFDLRQFLTENKLTKNAKLLKEEVSLNGKPVDVNSIEIDGIDTSDYPDFVDAYIIAADYEDGTPLSDDEVQQFQDENYDLVGELIHDRQLYLEGKGVNEAKGYSFTLTYNDAKYVQKVLDDAGVDAVAKAGTFDDEIIVRAFDGMGLRRAKQALEADHFDINEGVNEAKSYKASSNSKEAQHLKKGDIVGSGDEVVSVSAGAKTPSGKVEVTLKTKDGKTKVSTWGKTTKVGLKAKETVKENTMTKRDKYLTRLVENALGITPHKENPDHEFGTNAVTGKPLPNPNDAMVVEDEMADETVIPEYNSIDELMNSIDDGTNKVAEEHKMQEMKKIADALRIKAKKMEESEHAAHISPRDLKQLATDAAKLEKAAEKLKAAFDKKFNKKEKPAAAPKAEKVEALQEGTFDLRKFLIENKLTASSRMLKEYIESDPETITQAFSQAGVDLSAPTEVEAYYGHDGEDLKFVTGQEALAYLEDFRTEAENEDPNFNTEAGITFDYGKNVADLYEGDGTPKLAVNFGDSAMYIIAQ